MPYEKVSLKGKIKSKINKGKLNAKSAANSAYKMTSARKAALMKAVKASALARAAKAKFGKAGGNTAALRAKMKTKKAVGKATAFALTAKAITKGKGAIGGAKALSKATKNVSANRKRQQNPKAKSAASGMNKLVNSRNSAQANYRVRAASQAKVDTKIAQVRSNITAGRSRAAAPSGPLGRGVAARQEAARRNRAYKRSLKR